MRISPSGKSLVVVTCGDPRGIGPEVIIKALSELSHLKNVIFAIIGDYRIFQKNSAIPNMPTFLPPLISEEEFNPGRAKRISFINQSNAPLRDLMKSDELSGEAAMEFLSRGLSIVKKIKGSSLVTAPISKVAINKAGYKYAGHTEFLSHALKSKDVTMMLIGDSLKVSLVTRHVPLKDVSKSLTKKGIIKTAKNTYYALNKLFRIPNPKIAIAGLNPHAGESGMLGTEEREVIIPAIRALKKKLKGISGPIPPDTLFHRARQKEFDAVVCMYHDQGLIPLKMIAFDRGVNLTVGLPFIRTSPDHGTAFDIAGKGIASPNSMIEAIKLAASLA